MKSFLSKRSYYPATQVVQNNYGKELALCSTSAAREQLCFADAIKYQVLPISFTKEANSCVLTLATAEDNENQITKQLGFLTKHHVILQKVEKHVLREAIFFAYKTDDAVLDNYKTKLSANDSKNKLASKQLIQTLKGDENQFLIALIEYAIAKQASDIHFVPKAEGTWVKMRIDGILYEHKEVIGSLEKHKKLINCLKITSNLNTNLTKLPQDGRFSLLVLDKEINIRLSLMPTIFGEKAVLRLQGAKKLLKLEDLNLEKKTHFILDKTLQQSEGLIVFCGPTGSGKTTTMYAALDTLSKRNLSIATIEDPVEIKLPAIEQSNLLEEQGFTYEKALKSVLRQDPDVILIGEIRDRVSAEAVLQASLTGHLILTTVHAGSVLQALKRLKDLVSEVSLIENALSLIINQRLLATLCSHCKVIDLEQSNQQDSEIFKPVGCNICDGSGYYGKQIICESLVCDQNIFERKNINRLKGYNSFKKQLEILLKTSKIDYDTFRLYR